MSPPPVPPLIAGLLNPMAYPHPVRQIRVRQTHISWILLTGDVAYKIKKPVNLGFLDFTTLEQRLHFCKEELRLNRRYSTDLYLDVVPLVETSAGPRVGASGVPTEFAVRMRQFDERELATRLLSDGRFSPLLCDETALMVADMHDVADRVRGSTWGSIDQVTAPVVENFAELRPLIKASALRQQLDELEAWSRESAGALASRFQMRQEQGAIRECHGDLHLGNIVRWRGKMTLFDCIEFNEAYRWIDVLNEVAFLVMDLDDHDRDDLGTRILNAYLEQTGDYEGVSVLPYYLAYRAVVRAKVHAIRAQQAGLPRAESKRLHQECHSYLDLARRYSQPLPVSLTITFGVSGSGKTTGTQEVMDCQRAIRLRSDVERKRLSGLRPHEHAPASIAAGIYSPAINEQTYDRLDSLAKTVLMSGFPVIVDATFLRRAERERFRNLARQLGVPFHILPFEADVQTLHDRIQKRNGTASDASDATIAVLEHQRHVVEPLTEHEQQLVISRARPGTVPESTSGN